MQLLLCYLGGHLTIPGCLFSGSVIVNFFVFNPSEVFRQFSGLHPSLSLVTLFFYLALDQESGMDRLSSLSACYSWCPAAPLRSRPASPHFQGCTPTQCSQRATHGPLCPPDRGCWEINALLFEIKLVSRRKLNVKARHSVSRVNVRFDDFQCGFQRGRGRRRHNTDLVIGAPKRNGCRRAGSRRRTRGMK